MKHTLKAPEELTRLRVRCKEDFTPEELALLQRKLEGWIQQAPPKSGIKRQRHQFVMKSKKSRQLMSHDASDPHSQKREAE